MSRIIDAEKAIENTRNEVYWTESEAAAVRNFLNHQPTIDSESLRPRGRWLDDQYFWRCSECLEWLEVAQGTADMNYCPHCGAKMEETK